MSAIQKPGPGDTADFDFAAKAATRPTATSGRVRVDCAALSDQGLLRTHNEDHFLTARFGRFLAPLQTNMTGEATTRFEEEGYGMAVADCMGGAAGGAIASEFAIQTLLNLVQETPDWVISSAAPEVERVLERMAARYREIDALLMKLAEENQHLEGMGTTMTLACSVGDAMALAHIGDSRAYLWRAGQLHQLTHDHTMAQALVDQGLLRHKKEASERLRHALVRVLGGKGGGGEADVQRLTLVHEDTIVLCTDGLTDMVDDAHIASTLAAGDAATETCQALLKAALKNGGRDNVTVIVARYGFFDQPEA